MNIEKNDLDYKRLVKDILIDSKNYLDDFPFPKYTIKEFYNYVLNLPYIDDGKAEILARPKFSLDPNYKVNRDCDDKTLSLVSYLRFRKIPFRIIVSGRNQKPHHIYPEFFWNGFWIPFDATYPKINNFGKRLFPEKFREIFLD